ncbi:MAG TPA: acetoacetate--CoA ligase, partial [Solirubrobacter sp.]|nr:acetoacetate--CoA ligase [Solirubrobacter sp.]
MKVLWSPDGRDSVMRRFAERNGFGDFEALQRWSVTDLEGFWSAVAEFYGLRFDAERVLGSREMPGAEWFPGATLNYAEHMLPELDDVAVVARSQSREPFEWTFRELRARVAGARAELERLGVGRGDRVAAFLPNVPETLVGFLATASLGAIWASVSPEFGPRSVIDRFAQIEPKVLVAVDGYTHRGKAIDRREELAAIRAALPTLEHTIAPEWPVGGELAFEPVPFDHPLYVLFSSGTTGLPKAIVHGHGGILLEHHKNMGMTWNIKPGDRLLQPTTTAWMMWNAMVSALLLRGSIVTFDGDAAWPELGELWRVAEETEATVIGVSPAYLMACRKAGVRIPKGRIEALATAGSPLPGEGYDYVYEQLGPDVLLVNGSGGTDVCSAIVSGCPMLPVYRGEIAGRCLAVDTAAFDADGREVVAELGELVIRQPMPSMPVGFWGDDDGSRYRAAYFDVYPGVWRHGDWVRFSEQGTCVVTGRSDATLNRGGVRMGTAELYAVVEELPEVSDSLVVHVEDDGGGPGELILFVVAELDDGLRARIAGELRAQLSPRHVPDTIAAVPAIPRTLTGK